MKKLIPALVLALSCVPALADDQPFLTLYTTDIQTENGLEFEQWLKWKTGHANEASNEIEARSELEYGFTDDLQGSLYVNYDWSQLHPHPLPSPLEKRDVGGRLRAVGCTIAWYVTLGKAYDVRARGGGVRDCTQDALDRLLAGICAPKSGERNSKAH